MSPLRRMLLLAVAVLGGSWLPAAERIPPAPPRYFNDYAGVVSPATADQLNRQLEQFERQSSNQLLVAIYPKMESDSSVEDYTVRVAQSWRAGQAGRNNGAVLFAFMKEHQLYIQVGYGLEGALPDALAKRIIEQEIVPRFRAGDINGGMSAAVQAMIAATKGEYKGTGRTQADRRVGTGSPGSSNGIVTGFIVFILFIVFIVRVIRAASRPSVLLNPRRRVVRPNIWWTGGDGGGGWSGGGGGGGFSGGGGSFGGGGAGGKW